MYLNIIAEIIIKSAAGTLTIKKVNTAEIRSSWKELSDTATFTIPRNLELKGKMVEEFISRGNSVEIKLGCNGQLFTEFKGYVVEVEPNEPLTIQCEDEMFKLKQKSFTKSWETVTLKELLSYIAPGYQVKTIDATFDNFHIEDSTAVQVLKELQEGSFRFFSFFRDGILHCGLPYAENFNQVKYNLRGNVKENDLKFKRADTTKLRVKAIANKSDGTKETVEIGDPDGELRTLNFGDLPKAELKRQAEAEMKLFKFDGFRGSLTGFGWPRSQHGDIAQLTDPRYPERDGSYLIEKVTTRVGPVYFERINELGPKV